MSVKELIESKKRLVVLTLENATQNRIAEITEGLKTVKLKPDVGVLILSKVVTVFSREVDEYQLDEFKVFLDWMQLTES